MRIRQTSRFSFFLAHDEKAFTTGGIKLQATAKKRVTQAEIADALESWLAQLRGDGRSKAA